MQKKYSEEILLKYRQGKATEAEKAALENWVMNGMDTEYDLNDHELLDDLLEIRNRLQLGETTEKPKKYLLRFTIAASILIALSAGAYLFFKAPVEKSNFVQQPKTRIVPGGRQAILTLADGSTITLNSSANGRIARQDGAAITKTRDGELTYTAANQSDTQKPPAYNNMSTPRGGQYELILPDGTKVWLNAASSLKYPTYFTGKERMVELNGEAYFEVKKNKKMPFIVRTAHASVQVLGTHFNMMAYQDEAFLKTTLLEGAVRFYTQNTVATLTPGQQGVLSYTGGRIHVNEVKTTDAIAWKNGYFIFKDTGLRDMMNQISRWYDVDIEYQCDTRDKSFGGIYSKTKDINELLKGLELTSLVRFKIEGRRIIVTQ